MSPDSGAVPSLLPSAVPVGAKVTLHLGVIDQPYRTPNSVGKTRKRQPTKVLARTTFEVARILEAKYGLYSTYYRVHEADIVRALEESLQGSLETLIMRRQLVMNPWARANQVIADGFKDFINSGEAERVGIPGTPTKAALRGVSHRRKHPYSRRNPRRPSFRDTGMLVSNTAVWVD